MNNTTIVKRVNRILKYSKNAEQTALDTLKDSIGFDIAIQSNPKGVLKLLKTCVKKDEAYSNIWDLQFMVEAGKLELPEEYKKEYTEAIQELSSRLHFVPDEDDIEVNAESLWLDESEEMTLEEFADRDIIDDDKTNANTNKT